MKLQIDTIQKKLKLEEEVNLNDFFETIQNLLPNDLWKEFKFEVAVINNWTNPIIIRDYPIYPANPNPFPLSPSWPIIQPYPTYPWITCGATTGTDDSKITFNSGVYNVECQTR